MDKNYKPKHLLKGIIYLDNTNLEEKLIASKKQTKSKINLSLFDKNINVAL